MEVLILFTILAIAARKEVREYVLWRLQRPEPNWWDEDWPRKLDNWHERRPGR